MYGLPPGFRRRCRARRPVRERRAPKSCRAVRVRWAAVAAAPVSPTGVPRGRAGGSVAAAAPMRAGLAARRGELLAARP